MIKPTLNIKITDIKTGKEIFNENTNCIIGGCSDCNGNSVAIMNLIGTPSAVISALAANKTARKQSEKHCPIAALLYKALEPFTEKQNSEKSDSEFDKLIKELLADD